MLKKWNRQLQFGIHSVLYAIITIILPFCTSYTLFLVLSSASGFLLSFVANIPNVWALELFDKNSNTFLQLMHIFFPFGNTLGSLLSAPFVMTPNATANVTPPTDVDDAAAVNLFATAEYSKLWIPYLVVTVLRLLVAGLVFIAFFIKVSVIII